MSILIEMNDSLRTLFESHDENRVFNDLQIITEPGHRRSDRKPNSQPPHLRRRLFTFTPGLGGFHDDW